MKNYYLHHDDSRLSDTEVLRKAAASELNNGVGNVTK
jgi:hypothetical protein